MIEEIALKIITEQGLLGIILGWFMFRYESIIKSNTRAIIDLKSTIHELHQK